MYHFIKRISCALVLFVVLISSASFAEDLISLFPLENYNQIVTHWIHPNDPNYDKALLSPDIQKKHLQDFYDHYLGTFSPWNSTYIEKILTSPAPDDLKTVEQTAIDSFDNTNKPVEQIGYGANFRPYSAAWIHIITRNIDLDHWQLNYQPNNRAIVIDNIAARVLPTDEVHFYSHTLPGQGYPFDNLQMSTIWLGTPVYVITTTQDKAWSLVVTPDFIAWVKSNSIARTSNEFIAIWKEAAANKLIAIMRTEVSLVDDDGLFRGKGYVGAIFPGTSNHQETKLLVPVANSKQQATIKKVTLKNPQDTRAIPLSATEHNFANLYEGLIGRPYGWGGMYFYNDCSAELKSLYTPFGIWLPRHSSAQVTTSKMVDMSTASAAERLSYLMTNGHPFLTIVYIGGHTLQFVGNYNDPTNNQPMAMVYQNIWGLSPLPAVRRAVIGGAVLFPMKLQYPEDTSLNSLANKKYFQVANLDEFPSPLYTSTSNSIDLKSLMLP